ncbi:MAG: imidazole glycerol phosphate synthase subunit HisF [Opitutus sp.]|nr:imidazole glycerol phosphate synthase subunit HisF [Opitutus sp.]
MLARRIIPCLDVRDGRVVKGVQFRQHEDVGDVLELAQRYRDAGADEIVFYDITASSDGRTLSAAWVGRVARVLDVPFCVAGGIRSLEQARELLHAGADKVSLNSPALENPALVTQLAQEFGSQAVVVGIDSRTEDGDYFVKQYTGDPDKTRATRWRTMDWAREAQRLGAGEVVLNCMNQDGMRRGYDLAQLKLVRTVLTIPLVASGGAGTPEHFRDVFQQAGVDAALAASVFHKGTIQIPDLKSYLAREGVCVRTD